ncbi:MAG: ABC transporter permease, partial [Coriobacteriaceae bacterium]|nr:ABC transporter permease [Coriobacteriaceae bacterium]
MQVFRAALKTFFRHKVYIVVYMVALSFMAVFIGMSIANTPQDEFETERPPIAIIDRDKSSLSLGISTFLEEHADLVETEDSRQALQDTVAQNRAVYTLIVPKGFGKDFVASAGEGKTPPALETLTSYESSSAHMIDALVNKYLDTASLYAASNAAYSQADIASFAHSDMVHETNLQMLWFSSSSPLPEQWLAYMMFASYIVILSIVVNAGLILAAFNRSEIRRRNLSSSVSTLSRNLQLAAACVVVALITWVWVSVLGLVVFGQAFGG